MRYVYLTIFKGNTDIMYNNFSISSFGFSFSSKLKFAYMTFTFK